MSVAPERMATIFSCIALSMASSPSLKARKRSRFHALEREAGVPSYECPLRLRRRLVAVTELEFLSPAARTGCVRIALRVLVLEPEHHVGGRPAAFQELSHHAPQRTGAGEEKLQSRAQIILPRLAVLRQREAVLWTAAVAQGAHRALAALFRQRVALGVAELAHLRRSDELDERRRRDIAQLLARLDEMIAGVDVAVVLQRRPIAAGRRMDAEQMAAEIGLERHVEQLDEHLCHVAPRPFLENVDQEPAVLLAADRTVGDEVAGLRIKQALLARARVAPALVGDGERLGRGPLDDRDELHPFRAELVAEKPIDPPPVLLVGGVDGAKDVELDAVLAQKTPAAHHEVEGALPLPVAPVGVVQLARPVDAEAHQKIVLLEEGAPGVVEQEPVGLERLLHRLAGLSVLLDQFDRALEEFELHQRRLAPLPGDGHLGRSMRFQKLADIALER